MLQLPDLVWDLIRWALGRAERTRDASFREWEVPLPLRRVLPDAGKGLLLRPLEIASNGDMVRVSPATGADAVGAWRTFWDVEEDFSQLETSGPSNGHWRAYQVRVGVVAMIMAAQNQLGGHVYPLSPRLIYLGWREDVGGRIGVLLGRFETSHHVHLFTSECMTSLPRDHVGCVVVCPTFRLTDEALTRELREQGITFASLSPRGPLTIEWPDASDSPPAATDRVLLTLVDGGMFVRYCGQDLSLTLTQRRVLVALASRPSRPVALGDIGNAGWPPDGPSDFDSVRQIISQLRRKLTAARASAGPETLDAPLDPIRNLRGRHGEGTSYMLTLKARQIDYLPE